MKRKVQSLGWLTVLFTFALLWASPLMAAEYMLQIVNTWVSDENCNDLSGIEGVKLAEGGEFKYIPSTKTLIMKNVTVSVNDDWKAIWNRGVEGLTIEVSGTNLLETAKGVLAIEKTTLITGSGTLSVKSSTDSDYAVFVGNTTLTISNITLDASGKYGVVGVLNSNNGKLLLRNTDVVATGTESAVFALESFTTEKCRIAAPVGGSFDGTKHAIVDKKGNRAKEVKIAKGDPVAVTGVTVEPTSAEVEVNKTLQLTIKVEPNNATNKNYTCISDNTGVATVSDAGLVTAVVEGTANITVTTEDGNKTVSCSIKVIPAAVKVTGVTVEPTSAEVEVNKTLQLTIKVEPNNATNKNYTCISDNTGVATVSNAGLVTAIAEGTANITITTEDGNKTVSCSIKVIPAVVKVTGVTVEPTSAEVEVNKTLQLTIKVEPNNATNKNYTCISDNTGVATVSNAGLVTAVAEGTANITITTEDGNKTVSCSIKVIPAATVEDAVFASVVVSPNPFDTQLRILNGDLRGKYALCNTLGIDVISGILGDVQTQINTTSFPAGIYLLRLTSENGATKTFTVVKN